MLNHVLSPDAQVILLLCASFGQKRNIHLQPLTLSEYNRLAEFLIENKLRPEDLLTEQGLEILPKINDKKLNYERLIALLERGGMLAITVEKWVNQGLWIITRSDQNYPKKLKQNLQHLAPAIIYGVGNIELLEKGGLAIIGSRDINEEEVEYTNKMGKLCASQAINVISGGAKGIDQEAILGTLEVGGTAVGVLADSLNKASVSRKYRDSIRDGKLTLISTYDPDARFNVGNAMGRNKYIYALSDYALVVSSSLGKGGTWAGATEVLNKYQQIPVFVKMQGTVKKGNQALLDKGAKSFPLEPWNNNLKQLLLFSKSPLNQPENNLLTDTKKREKLENARQISTTEAKLESDLNSESASGLNNSENDSLTDTKKREKLENARQISTTKSKPEFHLTSESASVLNNSENDSLTKITNQKIYEKVLPIILEKLIQPRNEKYLIEILKIRIGQLRHWLNQACAEGKIIKTKKPVNYRIAAKTQQAQKHQTSTQQLSIYEAVLPIIIDNLEKPQTDKDLATKLNVNISQLQDWLKIAQTEGKITLKNQSNTYVINQDIKQLSLFDTVENNEEGFDW
ncbi:MAG: DNA-processing protein DprA [Okeania sp. SIO2C2]|uniref:DNA-processing protein DprA n=1 Tax=Okeania sp. SIO2C2 TaxID=2607787 RepID=UPI0013B950FD|nr:DNA-processing protein DprA [Okeania sp. SIO2C2]NEP85487.1 DNA-processing protein DprA [Okeania sp. SIO2C2]